MAEVYVDTGWLKFNNLYSRRRNMHWKSHFHCSFVQPDQIITGLGILVEMCEWSFINGFQVKMLKSANLYLQQKEDPCYSLAYVGQRNQQQ